MRTLHIGLRVRDLDRSLAFYKQVGYDVVGSRGRDRVRQPDDAQAAD